MPTAVGSELSGKAGNRALAGWLAIAAAQVALSFASRVGAGSDTGEEPLFSYRFAVAGIVFYSGVVAVSFLLARPLGASALRVLGLRRPRARWLGVALMLTVAALAVNAALEPLLHAGEEQGLAPDHWVDGRLGALVLNAVLIASLAPLAEELFFRGVGLPALAVLGSGGASIATAVVFALAHGLVVALPGLFVFALGLAWIRLRADSLWPAVLAHAGYNALGVVVVITLL